MTDLLESVLRGLGNGSLYAMLAFGFVIIFKATHVLSFAIPGFMLGGAFIVSYLTGHVGFYAAVVLGALAIAMLGLTVERVAIRPMVGRPVFAIVIITLGVDIVIRTVVNTLIGADVRQVGDPWGLRRVTLGGLEVQQRYIAMILTAIVVAALLFVFFKYSRIGLAMRATAVDQESALSQGVSVGTVFALSWAIAGAMAALAGTFVATGGGLEQATWMIALKALPAIVLGGLESLEGAAIGGLAVGVTESLISTYQGDFAPWLGANFAVVSPFVLMMLVLLIRPYGLFGTPEVKRV